MPCPCEAGCVQTSQCAVTASVKGSEEVKRVPWRAVEGHPCQQEGGEVTSPFWAEATAGTLEKGLASSAVWPEFAGERGVAGAAEGHGARACKDLTRPESSDFLRGARSMCGSCMRSHAQPVFTAPTACQGRGGGGDQRRQNPLCN